MPAIPFEVPAAKHLAPRLHAVLEAIYAAYGSGWDDLADPQSRWLPGEAITIGRTLVELMPAEPEALGLLSLMLHCEARREARRDDLGDYVPLSEQDVARWSQPMIEEAERTSRPRCQGRPDRTVPARGGDPVRACATCRYRRDRLGGDIAAL